MKIKDFVVDFASEDDLDQIVDMTDQWSKYFEKSSIHQWGIITYDDGTQKTYAQRYPKEYYINQMNKGNKVLVAKNNEGKVFSTLTLLSNDIMWPDRTKGESYFIHHLVNSLEAKNRLATLELLKESAKMALRDKKSYIRLDCSSDNSKLCSIYENKYGFSLVDKGSNDGYNFSRYEIEPSKLLERITELEKLISHENGKLPENNITKKNPIIGIVGKPYIGDMDYDWNEYTVISGRINDLVSQNNCIPIGITNVTTGTNLNQDDCLDKYELSDNEKNQIDLQIDGLDGIILQGGIQTCAYEEYIAKQAMEKRIPIMGICAGFNTIIRAAGGTIVKNDNNSHDQDPNEIAHTINIMPNSNLSKLMDGENEIGVNSVHWMIAKKDGIPQDKLNIVALSPDGLVEAVEGKTGNPIYGYKFHPEVMATKGSQCYNEKMVNIFTDFFEKCREYQHINEGEKTEQQLKNEIQRLRDELQDKDEQINLLKESSKRLQAMLKRTLNFADAVRKSKFAKFFFRKKMDLLPEPDDWDIEK